MSASQLLTGQIGLCIFMIAANALCGLAAHWWIRPSALIFYPCCFGVAGFGGCLVVVVGRFFKYVL